MFPSTSRAMVLWSILYVEECCASAASLDDTMLDPQSEETDWLFIYISSLASIACCCSWKTKCKRCLELSLLRISRPLPPSQSICPQTWGMPLKAMQRSFTFHHQSIDPGAHPGFINPEKDSSTETRRSWGAPLPFTNKLGSFQISDGTSTFHGTSGTSMFQSSTTPCFSRSRLSSLPVDWPSILKSSGLWPFWVWPCPFFEHSSSSSSSSSSWQLPSS